MLPHPIHSHCVPRRHASAARQQQQQQQVVIYSRSLSVLRQLHELLLAHFGLDKQQVGRIEGDVSASNRTKIIKQFNSPGSRVSGRRSTVVSPASCTFCTSFCTIRV